MRRRAPWAVWAVAMGGLAITASLGVLNGSFGEEGAFLSIAITMIVGYTTVGALISSRSSGNPIGWLLMCVGVGFLLGGLTDEYLGYATTHGWEDLAVTSVVAWLKNWVFLVVPLPIPWIALLFPAGSLPSRRWRPVGVAVAALSVLLTISAILNPGPVDTGVSPAPMNPTGIRALGPFIDVVVVVAGFGLLALTLASVAGLVLRYRRAVGEERQQMRWFVAAASFAAVLVIGAFASTAGLEANEARPISDLLFFAFFVVLGIGLPAACAVAILRYRLYDLDIVVKKTVLYTIVAIVLLGAFLVFAFLVGQAFIEANPLAILGSVGLGVALWPAIRIARRVADRLVYGGRASPYEVLTDFSNRLGGSYASDDVLPRMARVLADAVGAARAIAWLRVGPEVRPAGRWPAEEPVLPPVRLDGDSLPSLPADAAAEVRDRGELLGALTVSMPANDPINPSKERLVRDLAAQAGLVLRNVRLIEELRESRRRIVAAQDVRAKKLERDIHDGAQQRLVALAVKQRLAASLVGQDDARLRSLLADLQAETNEALEDLRDLARGIYPPLLADEGLGAALAGQTRRSTVPVRIDVDGIRRYPPETEAAVYFSCLEALQNVAKYARASGATVRLAQVDADLTFEVTDDGVGFDPSAASRGSGLQGIADRLAALGGELTIRSAPGEGTTVAGRVPVEVG